MFILASLIFITVPKERIMKKYQMSGIVSSVVSSAVGATAGGIISLRYAGADMAIVGLMAILMVWVVSDQWEAEWRPHVEKLKKIGKKVSALSSIGYVIGMSIAHAGM